MNQNLSEKVYPRLETERRKRALSKKYFICKCLQCQKFVHYFHLIEHSKFCGSSIDPKNFKFPKDKKFLLKETLKKSINKLELFLSLLSIKDLSSEPQKENKIKKISKLLKFYLNISKKSTFLHNEIIEIQSKVFNTDLIFNSEALDVALKVKKTDYFETYAPEKIPILQNYFLIKINFLNSYNVCHLHKNYIIIINRKCIACLNLENETILFIIAIKNVTSVQFVGDLDFLIYYVESVVTIWNVRDSSIEKQILFPGCRILGIYLNFSQSHAIVLTQKGINGFTLKSVDLCNFELEKSVINLSYLPDAIVISETNTPFFSYKNSILRGNFETDEIEMIYTHSYNIKYLCLSKGGQKIIFFSNQEIKVLDTKLKYINDELTIKWIQKLIFCRAGLSFLVIDKRGYFDLNNMEYIKNFAANENTDFLNITPEKPYTTSSSGILGPYYKPSSGYIIKDLIPNNININQNLKKQIADPSEIKLLNATYYHFNIRKGLNDYFVNFFDEKLEITSLKTMKSRKFIFSSKINTFDRIRNSNSFFLADQKFLCLWKADENSPYFGVYDGQLRKYSPGLKCSIFKQFLIISTSKMYFSVLRIKNMHKKVSLLENFESIIRITDNSILYRKDDKIMNLNNESNLFIFHTHDHRFKRAKFHFLNNEIIGIVNKNGFSMFDIISGKIFSDSDIGPSYYCIPILLKNHNLLLLVLNDRINVYNLSNFRIVFSILAKFPVRSISNEKNYFIFENLIYFKIKTDSKINIKYFEISTFKHGEITFYEDYLSLDFYEQFIIIRRHEGVYLYSYLNIKDPYKIPLITSEGYNICINQFIINYNDKNINIFSLIDQEIHEIKRKTENFARRGFWYEINYHFVLIPSENLLIFYRGHDSFVNLEVEVFDLLTFSSVYNFSNTFSELNILKIKDSIYIVEYDKEINVYVRNNNFIVKCRHNILKPYHRKTKIYLEGNNNQYTSINSNSSSFRKMKLIDLDDHQIIENTHKVIIYHKVSKRVIREIELNDLLGIVLSMNEKILVLFNKRSILKYDITLGETVKFDIVFNIKKLLFLSNDGSKAYITDDYLKIIYAADLN